MPLNREGSGSGSQGGGEYVKPVVVAIELKAEEVLGVGCKAQARAIPNVAQPTGCGITSGCIQEGS